MTADASNGMQRPNGKSAPVHDRFNSSFHAAARFVAQRGLLRPLVWRLTRATVIGSDQVKHLRGAYVVVANHSSHLDTPLIVGGLPRHMVRYLAAGAAADYFFDVWWRSGLTSLFFNAFPVQRTGSTSPRAISAKSLLLRGIPLLVFPEGTRSKTGEIGAFKPGAAALATSVGVPCVPVALIGVHAAHPRGTNWPKRGRPPVGVVIGKPMFAADGENATDFTERVRSEIIRLLDLYSADILGEPARHEGD